MVLVSLLMFAIFQSWLEPLVIMLAVPGALAGVLWMLVLTGTMINVESLMGAIMAVGVGGANGNPGVIFSNELREQSYPPAAAPIHAPPTPPRPALIPPPPTFLFIPPIPLSSV